MEKVNKIWMDGNLVRWDDAKVHVLTHSLHYGGAIFEGIRFYQTRRGAAVFRLNDHIERLFNSAESIKMKIPFSIGEIIKAILKLIKVNKINEGYIRPLVYYGYGVMGLDPKDAPVHVSISAWPWGKYLGEGMAKVKVSRFIRPHPQSTFTSAKICGHYINSILATKEAKEDGFTEALLLDYKGNVAEGPGENFFIVKNNWLLTPSLEDILPGITRKSIIQIALDLGYEVEEKEFDLREVERADEAFFTGTAAEITPISQIDDTTFNKGGIGPVTKKLSEKFTKIVHGEDKKYLSWLSYI